MIFMLAVALVLLLFIAAVVAAIANLLVRQQEEGIDPSVEQPEEA